MRPSRRGRLKVTNWTRIRALGLYSSLLNGLAAGGKWRLKKALRGWKRGEQGRENLTLLSPPSPIYSSFTFLGETWTPSRAWERSQTEQGLSILCRTISSSSKLVTLAFPHPPSQLCQMLMETHCYAGAPGWSNCTRSKSFTLNFWLLPSNKSSAAWSSCSAQIGVGLAGKTLCKYSPCLTWSPLCHWQLSFRACS